VAITVNFLLWNLKIFSQKRLLSTNGYRALDTIAATVVCTNTSVIGMLEVIDSGFAYALAYNLVDNLKTRLPGSQWGMRSLTTSQNDCYLLVFRTDLGFTFCDAYTTDEDANGNRLEFPSTNTRRGGRLPGAYFFQYTDNNTTKYFSVILYHAPGPGSLFCALGIENIPSSDAVTLFHETVFPPNNQPTYITDHALTACLIGGDFNVNSDSSAYNGAMNLGYTAILPPSRQADPRVALSTIKKNTQSGGYASTLDYRVNAFDNIFAKLPNTGRENAAQVVDLLSYLQVQPNHPCPQLALCGAAFDPTAIKNGTAITSNPLNNNEDAWHVYSEAISDHLPVYASYTF